MNLLFFGEDIFSVEVLRALISSNLGIMVRGIVMIEPLTISGKRVADFASFHRVPLFRVKSLRDKDVQSNLLRLKPDLIVSAHFQRILPPELFAWATVGAFNLHPSLLPKYRGMSPQHWPIVFGDSATAVTVHRMSNEVDTGNIMRQVLIPLEPHTYILDLQKKFLAFYGQAVVDAVVLARDGFAGKEQDVQGASYFHKIQEDNMRITLEMSVDRAYGMVRAFSLPYAGAWMDNLRFFKAHPLSIDKFESFVRHRRTPGIQIHGDRLFLVLNDGALEITKWKKI